jgi:hypothetical protein
MEFVEFMEFMEFMEFIEFIEFIEFMEFMEFMEYFEYRISDIEYRISILRCFSPKVGVDLGIFTKGFNIFTLDLVGGVLTDDL